MKKTLLIAVLIILGIGKSNAQDGELALGLKSAFPISDFSRYSSLGIGAELMYLNSVSNQFLIGGSLGYTTYIIDDLKILGQTIEGENISFLPINFKAMYLLQGSKFALGADLGYAVGVNDGNEGGLLYEPKLIFNNNTLLLSVGYQGITNDGDKINSVQVGAAFKF
tara:strand:- start:2506 stop:3006 length:501 start_codon:yes stop_codon:yes gene_type:complete